MADGGRDGDRAGWPRVLVVEDEPRLAELLRDVLPDMGYDPRVAGSAAAAQRCVDHEPIDLLLLDIRLPDVNGMDLLAALRERLPTAPAVILTAYGDLAAAQRAIRLEAVDFLTKPCRLETIEAALSRAAQRRPLTAPTPGGPRAREGAPGRGDRDEPTTLAELERRKILETLRRHAGNRTAAAAELGISRRTLYNRLKSYE